ncbi:hypothetical protein JWZ98_13970 [Methylomonas sp. EFPC1]|uniref:hypothetical protein n=1 Tax=Methylomonas sp. EFPC1 TaxID=2812647 RepID=UPI00196769AB|nr:hypothetical protein [Methylomonas sp. EFPC1]QSA99790.1 hypothetical protein JWZ98_13970 [Methylomonas sp. EFPC1]
MNLVAHLQDAGINFVHIIDDAFDKFPMNGLSIDKVQSFLAELEEPLFDDLCKVLDLPQAMEDDVIEKLVQVEGCKCLYENREKFGVIADTLFEDFTSNQVGEKSHIQPLIDFLVRTGIQYKEFGKDYDPTGITEPDIVFVDLKLYENNINIDECANVIKKLRNVHALASPLVFLMSSLDTRLPDYREDFRKKSGLFQTEFEAIPKKLFGDQDDFALFLRQHVKVLKIVRELRTSVNGWKAAIDTASGKLRDTLMAMDLSDYFVLYSNTTSTEKVGLGTYMTELLLEYIQHEIEETEEVWRFAKFLDEWEPNKITKTRFSLEPIVGELYSANMLHANRRIKAEDERSLGPKNGFLNLGDVFLCKKEISQENITKAWVVISPVCDLARPDEMLKRNASVLLCEGDVKKLLPSMVPQQEDGLPPTIIKYPAIDGIQYIVNWRKKRPHTWSMRDIKRLSEPKFAKWVLACRLRPLYALQIQHAVTADISRVGVQKAPHSYVPHGIEVLIANGNKWKMLIDKHVSNPRAGAISENKKDRKAAFILSDDLIRETLCQLRTLLSEQPENEYATLINELVSIDEIDTSLVAFEHNWSDSSKEQNKNAKPDAHAVYPLNHLVNQKLNKLIIVALQNRSEHNKYCVGSTRDDKSQALLVFKYLKL